MFNLLRRHQHIRGRRAFLPSRRRTFRTPPFYNLCTRSNPGGIDCWALKCSSPWLRDCIRRTSARTCQSSRCGSKAFHRVHGSRRRRTAGRTGRRRSARCARSYPRLSRIYPRLDRCSKHIVDWRDYGNQLRSKDCRHVRRSYACLIPDYNDCKWSALDAMFCPMPWWLDRRLAYRMHYSSPSALCWLLDVTYRPEDFQA